MEAVMVGEVEALAPPTSTPTTTVTSSTETKPETTKRGCMMCCVETTVRDFRELGPGDHITMPGMVPLYKHHAIVHDVDNISHDGQKALLTVIDVAGKGNCCKPSYPIKKHPLRRKDSPCACVSGNQEDKRDNTSEMEDDDDQIVLSACCLLPPVKQDFLWKVKYRKRCYDEKYSVRRANEIEEESNKRANADAVDGSTELDEIELADSLQYCFCLQNCEHFAASIVNGPESLMQKSPKHGISLQGQNFFLVTMMTIIWIALSLFYVFDLTAYALLVKIDTDFKNTILDKAVVDIFEACCLKKSEMKWIEEQNLTRITQICGKKTLSLLYDEIDKTDSMSVTINCKESWKKCDWYMLLIFTAIIFAVYAITLLCYYNMCLLQQKRICMPCFLTVLFTFASRLLVFVCIEVINNVLKSPFYDVVTKEETNKGVTILILVCVAAGGCILVYSLASLVVKGTYWIIGMCNKDVKRYNRFVPWRGILWVFCFFAKRACCCKDRHIRYSGGTRDTEERKSIRSDI